MNKIVSLLDHLVNRRIVQQLINSFTNMVASLRASFAVHHADEAIMYPHRLQRPPLLHDYFYNRLRSQPRWKKGKTIRTSIAFMSFFTNLLVMPYLSLGSSFTAALYLITIFVGGYDFFRTGLLHLLSLKFDVRTLLVIPLVGILLLERWAEGAVFVLLVIISDLVERSAIYLGKRSLKQVQALAPSEAIVKRGSKSTVMAVEEVVVGDIIYVDVDQQIPLDGVLLSQQTTVNEKIITGQSFRRKKYVGNEMFAGCLNEGEPVLIRVTKATEDTKIAQLIALVKKSQKTKAPIQHFIENFMSYYTPIVILLAILIAILPPLIVGASWSKWLYLSLTIVIIACPCALLISTPIVFMTSLANIAQHGILIKNGTILEDLSRVNRVAFDQIGTLTTSDLHLAELMHLGLDRKQFIQLSASISAHCPHPFSKAITKLAAKEAIPFKRVTHLQTIKGKGTVGHIDNEWYTIGSRELLLEDLNIKPEMKQRMEQLQNEGKTIITLSNSTDFLGFFALKNEINKDANQIIKQLDKTRIRDIFLLTENNKTVAKYLAAQLQIDHTYANLTPIQKSSAVQQLRRFYNHIAVVTNQAHTYTNIEDEFMLNASVNIANGIKENTDALQHTDIMFIQDNLSKLPALIRYSKKTIRVMKVNLFSLFLFKLIALLLVIPNVLTIGLAMALNIGATVFMLCNILRLTKDELITK